MHFRPYLVVTIVVVALCLACSSAPVADDDGIQAESQETTSPSNDAPSPPRKAATAGGGDKSPSAPIHPPPKMAPHEPHDLSDLPAPGFARDTCPPGLEKRPKSLQPGELSDAATQMFPRATASGFDMIWMTSNGSGGFGMKHAQLGLEGQFLDPPTSFSLPVVANFRLSWGAPGQAMVTGHGKNPSENWHAQLALVEHRGAGDVKVHPPTWVPLRPDAFSHSTVTAAWNPVDQEWGVLWEEYFNIDDNNPGYVYARLFWGRVTADGTWVEGSKLQLIETNPQESASISDWMQNPLIWDRDRFVTLWSKGNQEAAATYLVELSPKGTIWNTTTLVDAFSHRGVIAADGAGNYGVAWSQFDFDKHYNMRFTTVSQRKVGQILHLGNDEVHSSGASVVWDGTRYAVAWLESSAHHHGPGRYTFVDPAQGVVGDIHQAPSDAACERNASCSDWPSTMAYDGCQFLLAGGRINSYGWLQLFQAE